MTLSEIKEAVENNQTVYWKHEGYEVLKDNLGQFLVNCKSNSSCVGLTDTDGVLQGEESDFFIA